MVNPAIYDLMRPVVGNHEYHTPNASAYFDYFGAKAGDPTKGYYSYDVGSWHFVVLNSNCNEVGGCGKRFAQGRWLKADLADHPASCTAASFHHPLYTSSTADTSTVRPFWDVLYSAGADVILSGHAHYYERFRPQRPDGTWDPFYGLHEFVVGTGGAAPTNPMRVPRAINSVIDSEKSPGMTAYGVLKHLREQLRLEVSPDRGGDLYRLRHRPVPRQAVVRFPVRGLQRHSSTLMR